MTIPDEQWREFLGHFTESRNIKSAAAKTGISPSSVYHQISNDPAFADAVKKIRRIPTPPTKPPRPQKVRITNTIADEVWGRVIELLPTYRYLSDVAQRLSIPYAAITHKMASDAEFCNQIMRMIQQPNWGKFERNPQ